MMLKQPTTLAERLALAAELQRLVQKGPTTVRRVHAKFIDDLAPPTMTLLRKVFGGRPC